MPNDSLILDETNRSKLDGIVQQMISNGEQDADINFVVEDFKSKYGVKKKVDTQVSSEVTSFVPTPLNPTREVSTSQLGSGGLVSLGEIGNLGQPSGVETPKEAPKPSINKNKFEPTIADVNKKITDITLKQKYPEYGEFKSFAEASKQAISDEQKQIQLDAENRSKKRRLDAIPSELQELNKEKNELLLKKDYDSMKKLAAIDAVERRYDKLLKESEPKSYTDLNNLNKDVIKGMEDEVHQYINRPENKYIKEKIEKVGLTDIETNEVLLKATDQKTKPLIADLKQLTNEGIVDIAKQRMEMSKSINAKQEELKNIGLEIGKIEESELDKKGFKELNIQINKERANLDKLKPSITAIESDVKLINKEKGQIESEIKQYDSKINGNQWLGTEQELKKYNQLFSDYNVLVSKEKELYSTPELLEYNKQVGLLNSLQETKNGLVKGLQGTKYSELVAKYDLTRNDLNNIITKYGETDSPEINQKLNQYFALTNQLDKTTKKYEVARGMLVSLDELDRAKKEIENDPNYATDFGARALNSIADFGKGIAAFPFTFAASLHSDGGYHYSDAISDAIQGKGMEKGFLVNKNKSLINPETGKANWGVVPIINSIGDNLGTLLGFALTGRYLTPIVAGEVSGASSTIMEAQKATEIAKAYTTIIPAYISSYSGALDEAKELGFKGEGAFLYANAIGFLNGVSEMILPDQDLVSGKGVKTKMLKDFIENYSKNSATAVKDLITQFVKNGLGGASEEWIVMLGETAASSLGHLADSDIKAKIPTIDEIATTGVSSFVLESGMGMIGQYSENKTLNRLGKLEFAKDFENGKLILDGLKEKGTLTDDKYNKLVSDIQKYQSVLGQVPDGISDLKKVAIIEKMLEIKAIKANQPKEKSEVFEKIANKKINEIQSQIETIIDDKDFDKNEEKKFRSEMEEMVRMFNESVKSKPKKETQLQKFTSPTEDNYGTINRNDGKGIVTLTKEEYLNELQGKITTLESSIDAIDNEQSKAVVYEQVNELNKEKAEILKREIKPKEESEIDVKKVKYRIAELNNELEQNRISLEKGEMTNRSSKDIKAEISELEKTLPIEVKNETGNTDNNIPNQVESPQQEINITPIEVIAGEEQDNADGGVAKVVQGDGQHTAGYATIALDYLFTGGRDVIQSTDYFLQALVGGFTKASKEIDDIRNKYASKLGNIKDDIGTEAYNQMVQEIKDVVSKKYNDAKANELLDKIFNNSTGFVSREGNQVSSELETLNEQPSLPPEAKEVVGSGVGGNVKDAFSMARKLSPNSKVLIGGLDTKAANYETEEGIEISLKDDDGGEVNGEQTQADFQIDYIGNEKGDRGKGLASKELDKILAEADNNNLSVSLVIDSLGATSNPIGEKVGNIGLSNKELKKWYTSKGFIFDKDSSYGYRPSKTENASKYKIDTYQVKEGEIKIGENLENESSPQDLREGFNFGRLKEGMFYEDGDKSIYTVKNGKLKLVDNIDYDYRWEKDENGKVNLIEEIKLKTPKTNINENIEERPLLEKLQTSGNEGEVGQASSKLRTQENAKEEVELKGRVFRDNYNRTFEVKGEVAGILTLEDVDTGKILRKKKSEVLSNFKEITEEEVVDKAKIVTEALPKGGELKGITEVKVSENGEKVSYGTKTNTTSISVKGLSVEQIKAELEEEKKVLAMSKKRAENFNEEELWEQKGMTRQEKEDAIKLHKNSLLSIEKTEKIVIPFYEKHLELLTPKIENNAIQKQSTEGVSVRQQPESSKGVSKGNTEGKEVAEQGKEEVVTNKTETNEKDRQAVGDKSTTESTSNSKDSKSQKKPKRKSVPKGLSPRVKNALSIESGDLRHKVMQYFIGGGKINTSVFQKLFGKAGDEKLNRAARSEANQRFGLWDNKKGLSINQIAHKLWEDNGGAYNESNPTDDVYREAVEEVVLRYNGTRAMIDELNNVNMFTEETKDLTEEERYAIEEEKYYRNTLTDEEEAFYDMQQAAEVWENLSDEDKLALVNEQAEAEELLAKYDQEQQLKEQPTLVTQPTATPETKAAIEVYNKLKENNDTTTRKEYKALPESIKRVLDNIVNINKQLEQNKLITKKGNCP